MYWGYFVLYVLLVETKGMCNIQYEVGRHRQDEEMGDWGVARGRRSQPCGTEDPIKAGVGSPHSWLPSFEGSLCMLLTLSWEEKGTRKWGTQQSGPEHHVVERAPCWGADWWNWVGFGSRTLTGGTWESVLSSIKGLSWDRMRSISGGVPCPTVVLHPAQRAQMFMKPPVPSSWLPSLHRRSSASSCLCQHA